MIEADAIYNSLRKMCPFSKMMNPDGDGKCLGEGCEWWTPYSGDPNSYDPTHYGCAMRVIAANIRDIRDTKKPWREKK